MEVNIQLKPDAELIHQKGRLIPIHLQPAVGKEIKKIEEVRPYRTSNEHP